MFTSPLLRAALLLLVSLLPFLASGRTIPRTVPHTGTLSIRDVSISTVTVSTASTSGNHYPRGLQLSDGSVLIAHGYADASNSILQVLRSSDMGDTFSPYGTISERATATADMDNIFLLEVGSTSPPTVLAAFRNHDKDSNGAYTYFRITVCRSVDGGKTWSFLSQAIEYAATADSTGFTPGVWEPFMRVGNDGKIQLTYSGELAIDDQQTFRTISTDGSSWTTPVNLQIHNSNSVKLRDGMQGIAKTKDQANGREALVMVFESTPRSGVFSVIYAVSYDDGATYGNRTTLYQPAASDRNAGSPQIINLPTGNGLAVLFMTDENLSTVSWPNSAQVRTLSASAGLSGGRIQWGTSPQLVGAANSHWPGLFSFNGNVLGLFDQNGAIKGDILTYS